MEEFIVKSNIDDISIPKWDEFIIKHVHGNYFQSSYYYNFIKDVNTDLPIIIVCESNCEILGLLLAVTQKNNLGLFEFLTIRTLIIGGPLISDNPAKTEILETLLKNLSILTKNSIYIQIRNLFDQSEYSHVYQKNRYLSEPHLNYIVNTIDKNKVLSGISKSKIRQIKKSTSLGSKVSEAESIGEVKKFYEILRGLYKTKVKQPLPSWNFFKVFFEKNYGKYLLVKYKGDIIGGIMIPIDHNSNYEWYICGKDSLYKEIYPSVLATWGAIEYANNNNLKYFDFLGAGRPDKDYGVRDFKSKFGGNLVNYGRFNKVNSQSKFLIGKAGIALYKMLRSISKG